MTERLLQLQHIDWIVTNYNLHVIIKVWLERNGRGRKNCFYDCSSDSQEDLYYFYMQENNVQK